MSHWKIVEESLKVRALEKFEPKFRTLFDRCLYLKGLFRLTRDEFATLKRHMGEIVVEARAQSLQSTSAAAIRKAHEMDED